MQCIITEKIYLIKLTHYDEAKKMDLSRLQHDIHVKSISMLYPNIL